MSHLSEAFELVAVSGGETDVGFDTFLPAPVKKEALLGRKAEIAFIPLAVFVDAKIGKQLTHIFGLLAGYGDIVRRPRIRGNVVFSPTGITSGLVVHLQQQEVAETPLLQSPGGAQAGHAAAYNHQG